MRFAEKLRDRGPGRTDRAASGIPLPTSHRFTPAEWTAAYEALSDGSLEDQNAFEAGLFLFERMAHVRDELQTMGKHVSTFPGDARTIGLCAFLNDHLRQSLKSDIDRRQGATLAIEHALAAREIGQHPDGMYTTEEVLQGLIDGAKFPLRSAVAGRSLGVQTPSEPVIEHEHALFNELVLGRIYESFESAWQGVQWSGAQLHQRGLEYLLDETDNLLFAESRLDAFRRAQRFSRDGLEMLPLVERRTNGKIRVPVPEGDALVPCEVVDLHEDLRQYAIMLRNQRMTTTAREIEPFEDVVHPNLGLSIGKVIEVWSHLSFIASCCLKEAMARTDSGAEQTVPLAANARKFPKAKLIEAIAQCSELDTHCVAQVLQRFTFSLGLEHGKQDELWDRPLVPSGEDLILVWHPLIACEYTRLIARLASETPELRDAHATKGHRFEEHVVEVMQLAIQHAPSYVRQHLQVLQARIDPDDKRIGDVDVVLVVGDTAFVMECRTVRNAATAYEYWDVANDLLQVKGPQALRKKDYLNKNEGWLEGIAAKQGVHLERKVRRHVAVVVSNSYMFEGCRDAEPYHVHVDTLLNTILAGGPRFGDVVEGRETEYLVDHFGGFQDPAQAMLRAIASPPKAEMYRRCLHPGTFRIPGIGEADHFGAVRQWTLTFPDLGHLRPLLEQCSFAPLLREVPPSSPHRQGNL